MLQTGLLMCGVLVFQQLVKSSQQHTPQQLCWLAAWRSSLVLSLFPLSASLPSRCGVAAKPTHASAEPLQVGGCGFIHYNMTAEEQLHNVQVAKRHTPGMVVRPVCMAPHNTVADLYDLKVRAVYAARAGRVARRCGSHAWCGFGVSLHRPLQQQQQ